MCTWWRPWCPQRRHAWPIHQGAEGAQQSGSPEKWWLISCCNGQVCLPLLQYVQKCHSRRNSWLTLLWTRCQCQDGLASAPCKCRCCKIPSSCASSSYLPLQCSFEPCQLSWQLFLTFWAACLLRNPTKFAAPALFRSPFIPFGWVCNVHDTHFWLALVMGSHCIFAAVFPNIRSNEKDTSKPLCIKGMLEAHGGKIFRAT